MSYIYYLLLLLPIPCYDEWRLSICRCQHGDGATNIRQTHRQWADIEFCWYTWPHWTVWQIHAAAPVYKKTSVAAAASRRAMIVGGGVSEAAAAAHRSASTVHRVRLIKYGKAPISSPNLRPSHSTWAVSPSVGCYHHYHHHRIFYSGLSMKNTARTTVREGKQSSDNTYVRIAAVEENCL